MNNTIIPLLGPNGTEPTVPWGYRIIPLAGGTNGSTGPIIPWM